MILAFDLDDTLYEEITYVKSGFKAVSHLLYKQYKIPIEASYSFMEEYLYVHGRNKVFDALLAKFQLFNKKNVEKCVYFYHLHKPLLKLDPAAKSCIQRFKNISKYVVTDGNKIVQGNKIVALGLDDLMSFCFITHHYGIRHAKPSPYCFQKICKRENVDSSEVIFIGDNPHKDFIGIKPLGFKTVRILKGAYKNLKLDKKYEAHTTVDSLDEITESFLKQQ
jgi:putative hydrolase of the HAD superfamily